MGDLYEQYAHDYIYASRSLESTYPVVKKNDLVIGQRQLTRRVPKFNLATSQLLSKALAQLRE